MSNSLTRRRVPPRPRPMLLTLEKPSVMAWLMSAIPGPWSSNVSCRPMRPSRWSSHIVMEPPPPCTSVLRAISLAAVTNFVRSSELKPSSVAQSCAARLDADTWSGVRTSSLMDRRGGFTSSLVALRLLAAEVVEKRHTLVDVQRGVDTPERHAELDQGDRHCRPHADQHRSGIHDARHRRN